MRLVSNRPTSLDVWMVVADYFHEATTERLVSVAVDHDLNVIGAQMVTSGDAASVSARVARLFQYPIAIGAPKMLISHNHPDGNTAASKADMDFTLEVIHAGAVLQLPCIDHIIYADGGRSTSLKERGLILFGG